MNWNRRELPQPDKGCDLLSSEIYSTFPDQRAASILINMSYC